jgi:YVTN family beta-propeller protein
LTGPFNNAGLIAITPNGQYAYVANPGNNNVIVIDINTNTIATIIADPGFNGPYGIAVAPNGQYVYVANSGSTTISIIDTATNTVVSTIDGLNSPQLIAITPSGQYAYVADYNSASVSVIDLATNTIIATPGLDSGFTQPVGVSITPDGQLAYVSNYQSTTVSVIALPVSAPANLQGFALRNKFLLQSAPINRITWNAPVLPLPTIYNVYRDAALTDLAATIPATGPLMFQEYVSPGSTQSYYVTGTDGVGVVSPAASVVITQP